MHDEAMVFVDNMVEEYAPIRDARILEEMEECA
jgi:hypothetical protein